MTSTPATSETLPQGCPNCRGANLYKTTRPVGSGSGYAADFLPGLKSFLGLERTVDVVVCADCGLMQLYAREEARSKLGDSPKWERIY